MGQLLDALIGMDPSGEGALLLCAITAAMLGILLLVGFGLVRPTRQSPKQGTTRRLSGAGELGLPAVGRLPVARPTCSGSRPFQTTEGIGRRSLRRFVAQGRRRHIPQPRSRTYVVHVGDAF